MGLVSSSVSSSDSEPGRIFAVAGIRYGACIGGVPFGSSCLAACSFCLRSCGQREGFSYFFVGRGDADLGGRCVPGVGRG